MRPFDPLPYLAKSRSERRDEPDGRKHHRDLQRAPAQAAVVETTRERPRLDVFDRGRHARPDVALASHAGWALPRGVPERA